MRDITFTYRYTFETFGVTISSTNSPSHVLFYYEKWFSLTRLMLLRKSQICPTADSETVGITIIRTNTPSYVELCMKIRFR